MAEVGWRPVVPGSTLDVMHEAWKAYERTLWSRPVKSWRAWRRYARAHAAHYAAESKAEQMHTPEQRAAYMNALPFVRWDRCVDGDGSHTVYGWVDREDRWADFVLLEFRAGWMVAFTSSSARVSREVARRLFGDDAPHVDCARVEDVYPGVPNVIRLG